MTSLPRLVAVALVAGVAPVVSFAADTIARFEGGIGVTPWAAAGNPAAPVLNGVFDANPGGRPWVIRKLAGSVFNDGTVSIRGRGLLLAGGNGVGARGAIASVIGSLYCNGVATPINTQPAELDVAGNFRISGPLSAAPPNPCNTPVLLIRNGAGGVPGAWFAAGIPTTGDDD